VQTNPYLQTMQTAIWTARSAWWLVREVCQFTDSRPPALCLGSQLPNPRSNPGSQLPVAWTQRLLQFCPRAAALSRATQPPSGGRWILIAQHPVESGTWCPTVGVVASQPPEPNVRWGCESARLASYSCLLGSELSHLLHLFLLSGASDGDYSWIAFSVWMADCIFQCQIQVYAFTIC
jgi:hypothetical protein